MDRNNRMCEIIIEFGYCYIKMGVSQLDQSPRKIVRKELLKKRGRSSSSEICYIEKILHKLFDYEMVCSLRNKSIVMIYNYFGIDDLHLIIGTLLFQKFEVMRIAYVVGNVTFTGIVLDAGYYQTTCSPVYDGISLLNNGGRIGQGGRDICNKLKEYFKNDVLKFKQLDDIIIKYGKIRLRNEEFNKKEIYRDVLEQEFIDIFTKTFYGDHQIEESNIAYGFLNTLRKIKNIELINKIVQNLIITGGNSQLPQFITRFQQELYYLIDTEFQDLKNLKYFLTPVPQNSHWIGGSLIVMIGGHEKFVITQNKFKDNHNLLITNNDAFNFIHVK
ncbi:hypothetical protein pb186bvf_016867 [Paramecium bursaria]